MEEDLKILEASISGDGLRAMGPKLKSKAKIEEDKSEGSERGVAASHAACERSRIRRNATFSKSGGSLTSDNAEVQVIKPRK